MSNNKQSSIDWLEEEFVKLESTIGVQGVFYELLEQAKAMHKQEIMKAYLKHLPIEDGVITAVQKAEQYYKEKYGKDNIDNSDV